MKRPLALTRLIDTLDHLFDTEDQSRVVVGRAGMNDSLTKYSTRSLENWTNIVNDAIRQNALGNIVAAAVELRPDVPELQRHYDAYVAWAAQNVTTPETAEEIAAQKPPGFFERTRIAILAWFGIAVGCFAVVGIFARESTHIFFDLPAEGHIADAFTAPGEAAEAGLRFLGRTVALAGTYLTYNPIGFLLAIVIAAAAVYFAVRRPKLLDRAYLPLVVVPVIVIAALAKIVLYDMPALWFKRVLTTYSLDVSTFDPPQMLLPRAQQIWTGVVCSRVANFSGETVERLCGNANARAHLQNLIGGYLLNVVFTMAVCGLGIAVVRKLSTPSRNPRWNLPRTWKWTLAGFTAVSALLALVALPVTYARTVASMEYPHVCTDDECSLRVCAESDECFSFIPADAEIVQAGPVPPSARIRQEDILQEAFRSQLQAFDLVPHDRASRFPSGDQK